MFLHEVEEDRRVEAERATVDVGHRFHARRSRSTGLVAPTPRHRALPIPGNGVGRGSLQRLLREVAERRGLDPLALVLLGLPEPPREAASPRQTVIRRPPAASMGQPARTSSGRARRTLGVRAISGIADRRLAQVARIDPNQSN